MGVFERRRMQTKGEPQRRSGAAGVVHGVPWWGVVSSVVAPVLLVSGWTIAAGLQRGSYSAVADTVSVLAADGAADRWVMTLAFLVAGACEVMTGLALRPAASAGRLILMVGGLAGLLVASSPEPAGGGGSVRHAFGAVVGLVALAAWPVAAQQRGPSVPWGLRPVVSASTSVVLLVVLLWFGAELVTGGGQAGLAERLLGGMQTLWPVLVILSCRRRTGPSPDRSGTRWLASIRAGGKSPGARPYRSPGALGRCGHLPPCGGMIVEEWAADDATAILHQLGAYTPPWLT
jgi:hypothetical protein